MINKERLLNVSRALRESPAPEHFNMSIYVHECGTPACALGHYGLRQDLQSLLVYAPDKPYGKDLRSAETRQLVSYQDYEVLEHFGITYDQSEELFDSDGCGNAQTAIEAAQYLEEFVARDGR